MRARACRRCVDYCLLVPPGPHSKDDPMLRRVAIVSAFAATLAMSLLAGCGIRGPLTMPKRPPAPTAPTVPDPGLGKAGAPAPSEFVAPANGAAPSATSTPADSSAPRSPQSAPGSASPAK
ncbi:LPS translocon maturation chaperone LptM [Cupriavidus respiraculi]